MVIGLQGSENPKKENVWLILLLKCGSMMMPGAKGHVCHAFMTNMTLESVGIIMFRAFDTNISMIKMFINEMKSLMQRTINDSSN